MNKYFRRGLIYAIAGLGLCAFGYSLMDREISAYKWVLAIGVILFGIGFLTVIYSFLRKIERKSILDERKKQQNKHE